MKAYPLYPEWSKTSINHILIKCPYGCVCCNRIFPPAHCDSISKLPWSGSKNYPRYRISGLEPTPRSSMTMLPTGCGRSRVHTALHLITRDRAPGAVHRRSKSDIFIEARDTSWERPSGDGGKWGWRDSDYFSLPGRKWQWGVDLRVTKRIETIVSISFIYSGTKL